MINGNINLIDNVYGDINGEIILAGNISPVINLQGFVNSETSLSGNISPVINLSGRVIFPDEYDDYTGSYNIKPKINEYNINTMDKHMNENLKILAIPYYETENAYLGKTIIIGDE